MTSYDELDNVFEESIKRFIHYETEAREFMYDFRSLLIDSLNAPPDKINLKSYFEAGESGLRDDDMFYKFSNDYLMWLGKDGFWRFQIEINYNYGSKDITLRLWIQPRGDIVNVIFKPDQIPVPRNDISGLVEFVVESVVKHFETKFERFLDGEYSPGFERYFDGETDSASTQPRRDLGFPFGSIESSTN